MRLIKNTYFFLKSIFEYILVIIFICFIVYATHRIICEYMATFRNMPRSTDPAAWGQLGDYLGGLLNPTLSAATLVFVAMTYLTQKREIRRLTRAAEESEKIRKEEEIEQNRISERRDRQSLVNSMIASKYKNIDFFYAEIRRASEHLNAEKNIEGMAFNFVKMDGEMISGPREIRAHIQIYIKKVSADQQKILTLLSDIDDNLNQNNEP